MNETCSRERKVQTKQKNPFRPRLKTELQYFDTNVLKKTLSVFIENTSRKTKIQDF